MATASWTELADHPTFPMGGQPGVYVVFDHRNQPKYVGSSDRVWGRLGDKHVTGSEKSHAIQRAYREAIPEKTRRTDFIRKHVRVCILEMATLAEATALETKLIAKYRPAWNIQGIPGKSSSSPGVFEAFDPEFMQSYV